MKDLEAISEKYRQKNRDTREKNSSDRRIAILNSARRVLIEEGYTSFTLRRIATQTGIHLKTLQHYFDGKRELLIETVNYTLDNYYEEYLGILKEFDDEDQKKALSQALRYLILDMRTEETNKFYFELWALAVRDDDARDALDILYTRHRQQLELLIARANPRLSRPKVRLRATLMAAQIEGLGLFIGYGKTPHPEFEHLDEEAHDQLMAYALAR